jgi:hypothetical protein
MVVFSEILGTINELISSRFSKKENKIGTTNVTIPLKQNKYFLETNASAF